ncbi:MAG: glucose-1-phosphate adenylyltransferase [Clostridia bacterium]|nr:glucose-1-phosphate adenylyltransferase [Clostridia bacterium]
MRNKQMIAMLLAGGQGSRLGLLTRVNAKPAVPFGGRYRIIDFPLSNCTNSGIDTVGVLTQYQPLELNSYIGSGASWDLDLSGGGVFVLPPYVQGSEGRWYSGTANAIYQNLGFIEQYDPEYVLILSGDHIYKMDYSRMLASHIQNKADITIAVRPVPWEDAPSFGIMNTREDGRIFEFEEKPAQPKSNLASMGVYIFTFDKLKQYLVADNADPKSKNDFGKNIIPNMLKDDMRLYAYAFEGYWKDVGTIMSLWEAHMDLLKNPPEVDLNDARWPVYAKSPIMPPHFIGENGHVENSMVTEGCEIYGSVKGSVLSAGVVIEEGAVVEDSVIMPLSTVKAGAVVKRSIIAENAVIGAGCRVGADKGGIALVGDDTVLPDGYTVKAGAQVNNETLEEAK